MSMAPGLCVVASFALTNSWLAAATLKVKQIPCPFWRKKAGDAANAILRLTKTQHLRNANPYTAHSLTLEQVAQIIQTDLEFRQYYVTGKLTHSIYAHDCFFDAPDPDMPVLGVHRYADALSGLFDPSSSKMEVISFEILGPKILEARWRLEGHLQLPWRPAIKPFTGATRYELNADNRVYRHTETWSISVFDAFFSVLFPRFGAQDARKVDSATAAPAAMVVSG